LQGRVAFAWRAMDAFYEEDDFCNTIGGSAHINLDLPNVCTRPQTVTAPAVPPNVRASLRARWPAVPIPRPWPFR
jgi:hypothetical protein